MNVKYTKPLLMLVLLVPFLMTAATWYVHPDSALNSIQAGLDFCAAGDTVLVGPGLYYENIIWPYVQGLKLISEHGPDTTIIDAQNSGSVIYLSLMPEDSTAVINGFTLRNGETWQGGGIYSVGGKATISGNIITGNICHWPTGESHGPPPRGGGIYTEWSSPLITNNIITNNTADEGGAISCLCDAANIAPTITRNTIALNSAHIGGGIEIIHPFTMTVVRENIISSNTADYGGGIACYYVFNPLLTIAKNTIIGNSADSAGGGIWCYISSRPFIDSCTISENINDGIYSGYFSSPVIRYNNITDNEGCGVRNVDATLVVLAENNWWGHATGPYNPLTNPAGLGDTVSHFVDYDPWLTSPGTQEFVRKQPVDAHLRVEPNPFRKLTTVSFCIEQSAKSIALRIYDISGRTVRELPCTLPHAPCSMQISWDGTDQTNRELPSGVYFVRLKAGDYTETEKTLLLR